MQRVFASFDADVAAEVGSLIDKVITQSANQTLSQSQGAVSLAQLYSVIMYHQCLLLAAGGHELIGLSLAASCTCGLEQFN